MLLDLLKSQRTSRGIRGWHCCAVPVKFHSEEKILHHTHTNTHNECTNASMYLLKQTPIKFFLKNHQLEAPLTSR